MKTRQKWTIVLGVMTLVVGASASAPQALRRMDTFNVKRVEVRGTHYLAPHEALRHSGITAASNIFDDPSIWVAALEQHPLVESVRLERDVPGTIRIYITEAEPVALVRSPELQPVRAEGLLLPLDPSEVDLDLPVVIAELGAIRDGRIAEQRTADITRTLEIIRTAEPTLFGWISDASAAPGGGVQLRLRSSAHAKVFVPSLPEREALLELRLTLSDLAVRQELARLIRIDARYRDQVVVALTTTAAT